MATDKSFKNAIPLNEKLSIADAIEKLATFHGVTAERIKEVFSGLNTTEGTVTFNESVNSSAPCIRMEIYKPDGSPAGSHVMNISTGNSEMRCG